MIERFVIVCGSVLPVVKGRFFPNKSRFGAFTTLNEDQRYGAAFLMAQQTQPFWLQLIFAGSGNDLGKTLRLVHKMEIAAEFKCPCGAADEAF